MNNNLMPHIRIAHLNDCSCIAEIYVFSRQKMYKDFIPESILNSLSIEELTDHFYEQIKKEVRFLIMEIEKKIVGFASIGSFHDFSEDISMGEVSAIYLLPDYWRKGLGTKLCLAAISELESGGYKKVLLWVFEDNFSARKFYDSLGFEKTNVTKLEEFYEGGALLKECLYQKIL